MFAEWILPVLSGAFGVKVIDVLHSGFKSRQALKGKELTELELLQESRMTWRLYSGELRAILRANAIEPPPEPDDTWPRA